MKKLLKKSLILSCILHLASCILFSYPPGWSDDILLTPETSGYRNEPDVSVDSYNNVWVIWDSVFWGDGYIYYTKRDSLGNCIISETALSDPMHSCGGHAKVVLDNSDNIHIQWTEPSPTGNGIGYAKLDNDGSIIVNPNLAMPGYGGGESCNRHEIALDKYKNINVVWDEQPLETNQISYTKLDSLGDTLIARIRISPTGIYSIWPGIGVDSFANNHMAYRTGGGASDSLTYSKLDKDGNILISNKILGTGGIPVMISDQSQNIHMIYADPAGPGISIEYLKLDQEANILVGPITLSINEYNNYPHMAMDSLQYLHVVWDTESGGAFPIMYAKLDTLGNFVIPPMQVVYPPYTPGGGMARIAVDRSNKLHLVWVDGRLNPGVSTDIFYKRGENENTVEEMSRLKTANLPGITVFPNPFSEVAKISFGNVHPDRITHSSYGTGSAEGMELKIFDASGRLVRSFPIINLCNPNKSVVSVYWAGTDDIGNHLPAGVYFIRLSSAALTQSTRVILLK
ncbi:hypothetical protein ES705_03266 [subsurface metagenome]|jgi:hypothetical protein